MKFYIFSKNQIITQPHHPNLNLKLHCLVQNHLLPVNHGLRNHIITENMGIIVIQVVLPEKRKKVIAVTGIFFFSFTYDKCYFYSK